MKKHYDVIVIGGGPSGIAAGISAAKIGAKTLVVERYGFLGGSLTNALVHPFMNPMAGKEMVNKGIFKEVVDRLISRGAASYEKATVNVTRGGAVIPDNSCYGIGVRCDPDIAKIVYDEMLVESGASVLFHSLAVDTVVVNSIIREIIIENISGRQKINADIFIDASGDGIVASRAGCPFQIGRSIDNKTMPATLIFTMANVDLKTLQKYRPYWSEYIKKASESDELHLFREDLQIYQGSCRPNEVLVNTVRICGLDLTNAEHLSKAEILGRKQIVELTKFLIKYVPGFKDAYLNQIASQVGIRETRRIIGEYILTGDDIVNERNFKDVIARGSYGIDIHNPEGSGTFWGIKLKDKNGNLIWKEFRVGGSYDIPYRCLVPLKIDNILVTGRCISATHEALASLRIQPIAFCLGHAAGVSAGVAAKQRTSPRYVDVKKVQNILIQQGANLGNEV